MKILVTGGTGYIGSHTCVELLNEWYEIIIVDNLSNSKENVVDKIKLITNKNLKFYKGDCCDKSLLTKIFSENKIDAVIHFAGLKAVGESVRKPLMYYRNNLDSTLTLLEVMKVNNVNINYKIAERRQGDIDACYADLSYAKEKLNWEAKLEIEDMCKDAYNYIKNTKGDK